MSDFVVRAHGRRPGPHIPVKADWRISVRRIAPRTHVIVAANLDVADFSEFAGFDDILAGLDQVRRAAPLHVHLHNAFVLSCRS